MRIALVGCGFLGSLFAEEMAKRFYAFDERSKFLLIDFDNVEERNAANQNFTLYDAEIEKAEVVKMLVEKYELPVSAQVLRVDKSNVGAVLDDSDIIVSAVDNLPTRDLLWYYARGRKIPLLTMGISQSGTGTVEWTHGNYDAYSLSPLATLGQRAKLESAVNIPKELKPCELIAFRGLGLNTAIAAAKALGIFMGFDPEHVTNEHLGVDVLPRTVSAWDITNTGHTLREIKELED